jgi:hypothetical protein
LGLVKLDRGNCMEKYGPSCGQGSICNLSRVDVFQHRISCCLEPNFFCAIASTIWVLLVMLCPAVNLVKGLKEEKHAVERASDAAGEKTARADLAIVISHQEPRPHKF